MACSSDEGSRLSTRTSRSGAPFAPSCPSGRELVSVSGDDDDDDDGGGDEDGDGDNDIAHGGDMVMMTRW